MASFTLKKKLGIFPFPAGDELSLAGNNSIVSGQGEFG
jgi:hypothetical protein